VSLAPAKAATASLAALGLIATRLVETDVSYQALLVLSLFLTMLTVVLFLVGMRRNGPSVDVYDGQSLKTPLVDDDKGATPDPELGIPPSQEVMPPSQEVLA